jgi:hypothetical protein
MASLSKEIVVAEANNGRKLVIKKKYMAQAARN